LSRRFLPGLKVGKLRKSKAWWALNLLNDLESSPLPHTPTTLEAQGVLVPVTNEEFLAGRDEEFDIARVISDYAVTLLKY